MLATYHNHSTFSDGKHSIAEMVDAATALGVDELGVSDHLVLPPRGDVPAYAMNPDRLEEYITAIRSAERPGGPAMRIGLEIDYFPEMEDELGSRLEVLPLDVRIGAVHCVDEFVVDSHPRAWKMLDESGRNAAHRGYWRRIEQMARSGLFDMVAHLDLPKKFGYHATDDLSDVVDAALDAIAAADLVVEVSTAGWHKPCLDAYPSIDLLQRCHSRHIAVTISADAHDAGHLVRDFKHAAERIAAVGYEHVARFDAARRRWFEPVSSAAR